MPLTGTFFTADELQSLLGVTKQRISNLAQNHIWASPYPGLYDADDVTDYLWSRWRRDLARQFGFKVSGLIHHDEWDRNDGCPACGSFAIWKPATIEEIANGAAYGGDWPWRCASGHSSED